MTLSTKTRTQPKTKTKKRVKFTTKATKPVAQQWTEEQYERELSIYLDRKQLLKDIEKEVKSKQAQLLQYMEQNEIQSAALDDLQIVVCRRKVWKYSDELRREANRISALQREEQKEDEKGNTIATYSESVYLTIKPTTKSEIEE